MKYFLRILFAILLLLGAIAIYNYPKLNIISGYAAKNMASTVFISGRPETDIVQHDNNVPLIKLAETHLDPAGQSVTASVYGLMQRKAVRRGELGCVLINDSYDPAREYRQPHRQRDPKDLPFPYGDGIQSDTIFKNVDYPLLQKAIDNAFVDSGSEKTRTVLVVYKDQILAERYSGGVGKDTPVLGWSMTKSILATLFGILEFQGKLSIQDDRPFQATADVSNKGGAKAAITLDHLLRMQSGLAWDEDYTSISDVTRMLFLATDMTRPQAEKKSLAAPTEIWNYSSGTTNYLSGYLRGKFTIYQEYLDFPYAGLIDRIGMHSMLLEADMAGNYVLSSYGWATTRDWARFGLLYLHRGNWNGEQLFDPRWVEYVTEPTAKSDGTYGAHFWLNANGKYPGIPKDLYSANGYQGQYVFIIPSKDLVIVRTGLAEPPDFNIDTFLNDILKAIR